MGQVIAFTTGAEPEFELPINHKLREWRRYRLLTMEQFAELMGVSHSVVSRVERGQQQYRQDYLEKAAKILRCEPSDLIIRDPTQHAPIWDIYAELDPASKEVAATMLDALLRRGK